MRQPSSKLSHRKVLFRTGLTPDELAEIYARPTRYFLDDGSGTLYRFAYSPNEFHGRFVPGPQRWVPDREAEEFISHGGYMTEITAAEAATVRTRADGLASLARTAGRTPFLPPA